MRAHPARMQPPRVSPRIHVAAAILAVLALAGVALVASGAREVGVQQAYFVAAEPEGDRLNLTARLFVTNHALTRSDGLSVTVFVVPTHSGLASYTTRVDVGTLEGRTTNEVTVPIVIPQFNASRSYRVDFLVFEDGLLTQKGAGNVGWGGGYWSGDADGSMTRHAVAEGLSASAPSFERVG